MWLSYFITKSSKDPVRLVRIEGKREREEGELSRPQEISMDLTWESRS